MNKLLIITGATVLTAMASTAAAKTYNVSGVFASPGGVEASLGGPNIVDSGALTLSGSVTTDTDAPGYAITGGTISILGVTSVLEGLATLDIDITGTASNAGVLFNAGTVCVTVGAVECDLGLVDVSVSNFDFRSGVPWSTFETVGIQLTGGAGGTDFSVAQAGSLTANGFSVAAGATLLVGNDAGIFLEGDIHFSTPPPPPAAPNLVVIALDSLSTDAMQALLDGGWLPNINTHLIQSGVNFENSFVTTPESSPSRATLLRGQYAHNHSVLADHGLNPLKGGISHEGWLPANGQSGNEQSTIATWLQDAGYRTGFVGKYLDGYGDQSPVEVSDPMTYVPPGWNTWNGLLSLSAYSVYDYDMNDNGAVVHYGAAEADYQTDVLAGRAGDFIANPETAPFFLLVTPLAPHVEVLDVVDQLSGNDPLKSLELGIRPAPRHAHLIDGEASNGELPSLQVKPSFNESNVSNKPGCPRPTPPVAPAVSSGPACVAEAPLLGEASIAQLTSQYKSMLASVVAVDDLVGTVIENLNTAGKLDNTVIIFTSSNGWSYGEHRLTGNDLAYEESIRVPFIIRAPGGKALSTSSQIIVNNDIAPTLADLADITPPYDPDGNSIMPLVEVSPGSVWPVRNRFLVERWYLPGLLKFDGPTYLAMRQLTLSGENLAYIASRTDPAQFNTVTHRELYDVTGDPDQLENIELSSEFTSTLDSFLFLFSGCTGATCNTLESF